MTFTVRAKGTQPLTFQWYKDGAALTGETGDALTLLDVADESAGQYHVTVTNPNGTVDSRTAGLEIVDAQVTPRILKQPDSRIVISRQTAFFSVVASGGGLSYQWFKNDLALAGETDASLILNDVTPELDAGIYHVVVSNPVGSAVSVDAHLEVIVGRSELGDAVEYPGSLWQTAGDAAWFSQSEVVRDGVDALQSGGITDDQKSVLKTEIEGPGTISFFWRVSSEENYDYLHFYLNGQLQDRISGEVDWEEMSFSVPSGLAELSWVYEKDATVSNGSDAAWVDDVFYDSENALTPRFLTNPVNTFAEEAGAFRLEAEVIGPGPIELQWQRNGVPIPGAGDAVYRVDAAVPTDAGTYSLLATNPFGSSRSRNAAVAVFSNDPSAAIGQALDTEIGDWDLLGTFSETNAWFAQNTTTRDGVDALQAGDVADDETTAFTVNITGPGIVAFWWRTSSEENYDFLDFFYTPFDSGGNLITDEENRADGLSGETNWSQVTVRIPDDRVCELFWQYSKDESVSEGMDTGWVDRLVYFPASEGPAILSQSASRVVSDGQAVELSVEAASTVDDSITYQWYKGRKGDLSSPVTGGTFPVLGVPNITQNTDFWVRVTDLNGSTDSETISILVEGGGILSLFPRSFAVGDDWYFSRWLGLFQAENLPWMFHESHGWWFTGGPGGQSHWFYDLSLGWLFTTPDAYPYLWSLNYGDWIYYAEASRDPRYIYVFPLETWLNVE